MKTFLMVVAVVAAIGAIVENKKGWYVALFAISALLYIAISAVGGAA